MTPASRYPFGPRGAARYLQAVHSLVAQYGGDCWPLDDAPGSAVARSLTGAYPGAVSATGVTFGQQGPLCAGQYAGAAGFAAGNISVGGVLLDPSTAFSFCSWVNCTAPAGATEQVVFASAASSAKRFTLSIASGNLRAAYNNGSTTYAKSGAISTGWNFVALSKDAGNAAPTLWINGVAQAGTTAPTFANTVDTVLSQRTDKTQGLTGSQFAPAIFKAAIIAEVANTLRLTATQGD